MPELFQKPSEFIAGQNSLSARSLNKILAATPRVIKGGAGGNVTRIGDKYLVGEAKKFGKIPASMCLVTISSIQAAYLTCNKDGAIVYVAKPWGLRSEVVFPSGYSYVYDASDNYNKRTASDGTDTETQYITPGYEVDEELLIMRVPSTKILNSNNEPIVWIDINCIGRFWAMKEE